jgi:tetratricopeptide (TPR) repeat protein
VLERTYSTTMLADVLEVSRDRITAWVKAGLLKPNYTEHGVWHFDFKQVSAAKTLCDLARRGVTIQRIRRSLEHLRCWLPEAEEPLQRLATLNDDGRLLVRLAEGDLAGLDGQLHFDFTEEPALPTMRITPGPRTAAEWYEQGIDQEAQGYFADAEHAYRHALTLGGPDARICFSLANVLRAAGQKERALERYRQAVEIDATFADAWNNLGVLLVELEQHDEACSAFRKALEADSFDLRAHYNLADTLEEMGKAQEALVHWQAYLRQDPASAWGKHARSKAIAICPF